MPGWVPAIVATILFTAYTLCAIPVMHTMIFEFSWLRLLCIPLVILSGIVEKDFFRKIVMDAFDGWDYGLVVKILISAVVFAFAHIIWGFFMLFFIGIYILGLYFFILFIVFGLLLLHIFNVIILLYHLHYF